jgi:DNA repair photolyase
MPKDPRSQIIGRGADVNPVGRFEKLEYALSDDADAVFPDDEAPVLRTEFFNDVSRTIVTENNSPDVGFRYSVNPYRGCEHGCAYCYARPNHEYMGLSAGLDFESKIFVKMRAADLLRERLLSKKWQPELISMSGVTDCYQPIERKLQITRGCLEVFAEFRNPVSIITKNHLVTRDIDLLGDLAQHNCASVFVSLTTLDPQLARRLEPRTSAPQARLQTIAALHAAKIPVGVMVAPVIPGLNDHEIPNLLKAAREAGAQNAGYVLLRLPLTVAPIFSAWLNTHEPLRKQKVLAFLRGMREGRLNNSEFGERMRGTGPQADLIKSLFRLHHRKLGFAEGWIELSTAAFRRPTAQMDLFGGDL